MGFDYRILSIHERGIESIGTRELQQLTQCLENGRVYLVTAVKLLKLSFPLLLGPCAVSATAASPIVVVIDGKAKLRNPFAAHGHITREGLLLPFLLLVPVSLVVASLGVFKLREAPSFTRGSRTWAAESFASTLVPEVLPSALERGELPRASGSSDSV